MTGEGHSNVVEVKTNNASSFAAVVCLKIKWNSRDVSKEW